MREQYFKIKPLSSSIALLIGISCGTAIAEEDDTLLDTITVTGSSPYQSTTNRDATGLGQILKTNDELNRKQVQNIRDLVRYDPGVTVTESAAGRGTSSGFSIRGAEKNRVAILVDGLNQAESLERKGNAAFGVEGTNQNSNSGALNEVEFENLKLVEINKGANSIYAGSGAIGGAVLMQTKDTSDFVLDDRQWGGRIKGGYSSKDKRWMGSIGLGGKVNGIEGFIQYTARDGKGIQPHPAAADNLPATTVKDVIVGVDEINSTGYLYNNSNNGGRGDSYNTFELKPRLKDITFSAEDYAGPARRLPNPLDYDSSSVLSKLGYRLNDTHYAGIVFEQTQQNYDMQDLFGYNYHSNNLKRDERLIVQDSRGFNGVDYHNPSSLYQYRPSRFFKDHHKKQRFGLEYTFSPSSSNAILDRFTLNLDHEKVDITSLAHIRNCATWPSISRDCDIDAPGKFRSEKSVAITLDTNRIAAQAEKTLHWGDVTHNVTATAGVGKSEYRLTDAWSKQYKIKVSGNKPGINITDAPTGQGYDHYVAPEIIDYQYAESKQANPVHRHHYYLGLQNTLTVTPEFDVSLGTRYDVYRFNSDQGQVEVDGKKVDRFTDSDYKNFSWSIGAAYRPIDDLNLSYKYSTGFRVPSFGEQLGFDANSERGSYQPKLNAEKATNHEFGIDYDSNYGHIGLSYFMTDYRDLIAVGSPVTDATKLAYFNQQSVKLHGFNASAEADAHQIWSTLPDGLKFHLGAGMVKVRKKPERNPEYNYSRSYMLDMVQPFNLVYGASYDDPSQKWGIGFTTTYTAQKASNDLVYEYKVGQTSGQDNSLNVAAPSWTVTDVTGYYEPYENLVIRGGIYNIFNYKYIDWSSLRTVETLDASIGKDNDGYRLLAAPGRNYYVGFEYKF